MTSGVAVATSFGTAYLRLPVRQASDRGQTRLRSIAPESSGPPTAVCECALKHPQYSRPRRITAMLLYDTYDSYSIRAQTAEREREGARMRLLHALRRSRRAA